MKYITFALCAIAVTGCAATYTAPICPTCHRAIHRYYDDYLKINRKSDFDNKEEAHEIYFQAKQGIVKGDCYV